ncbi:hypothetical protein PMAYCL1PPCAC_09015 [Pristionchus mayeri]|uniref:Activin types I and II receptor domain-containing protein n=1 Tax=Pristionchus mayeri TaxID=1317129 RepID=A0AAN4ZKS3_9BILA|nr:hypothetical protein PMAYCL1PPCAC_09015 [Pristionchus mayeri]
MALTCLLMLGLCSSSVAIRCYFGSYNPEAPHRVIPKEVCDCGSEEAVSQEYCYKVIGSMSPDSIHLTCAMEGECEEQESDESSESRICCRGDLCNDNANVPWTINPFADSWESDEESPRIVVNKKFRYQSNAAAASNLIITLATLVGAAAACF